MTLLLVSLGLLFVSGLVSLATARRPRVATVCGVGGAVVSCALGLIGAGTIFIGGNVEQLIAPWSVPFGSFHVRIDALSAFFLLPILGLSGIAAPYGAEYLLGAGEKQRGSIGAHWFFYNLLVAGMVMVVLAWNGVLFLMAWEVMSLASYFLVTFNHEEESVRRAGWIYLVATHIGTAFLFVMFLLLGRDSLDFDAAAPGALSGVLFVFAIIGFGTKAGFMPMHVWLPEAHPAAPSHVSAVMSGVMIKTGIYGILRMATLLGAPPLWWGWLLIGIGATSGILGVLFALAQHDLKRLLAYSSVENIGIIALGLGIGMIGLSTGNETLAVLGFAGGLLHVINHAFFKGLLFLGAGCVLHATGTLEMDRLGGLLKKMPWTGSLFLLGAAAICALPPLNGFISEFLIYSGALQGPHVGSAVAIGSLALIGGLAAACFTKAFGVVFLGVPREDLNVEPHDPGWLMRGPMVVLALGCITIGALPVVLINRLGPVIEQIGASDGVHAGDALSAVSTPLSHIVAVMGFMIVLIALLGALRRALLLRRTVTRSETWGCGYAHPTPRMQYTSSSYAKPITSLVQVILRIKKQQTQPTGLYPREASLQTHSTDVFVDFVFRPIFQGVVRVFNKLHGLQNGHVHLYVLYIMLTFLTLMVWKLT